MLANRIAPLGDNVYAYAASGALPYILCMYPARMMSFCLATGKPLLSFAIVKPLNVMISRCIVEVFTALLVAIFFVIIAILIGVDILPENIDGLLLPIFVSIYLGIGFGFFNVIIISLFGQFGAVAFFLLMFVAYIMSGAISPLTPFASIYDYLWWNPLYQLVHWLRSAYFTVYEYDESGRVYVIILSSLLIAIGLGAERLMRGRF
jgi:capsular polysaccharide transport system permease protein